MRIIAIMVLVAAGITAAQANTDTPDKSSGDKVVLTGNFSSSGLYAGLPGDAVLCKMGRPYVGSRIGAKQICHTVAHWRQIYANGQYDMERMQTRSDNAFQTHQ